MADERSIVITLKLDADSDTDTENQTNTEKKDSKNNKDSTNKKLAAWAVKSAVDLALNETVAWAEYAWNKELTLTDDYVGQRNKQIAMTQISRGIGFASSIAGGAIAGSAFGPIGAVIGAALGTVTSLAGIIRSNLQGQEMQNIQLRQMNAQLEFTRSRAGWSLEAASIGEDL